MSLYDTYTQERGDIIAPTGGLYSQFLKERSGIKEPSTLSKFISGAKDYAQKSAETMQTFGQALLHPIESYKKLPSVFETPFVQGINKAGEGLADITNNYGMAKTSTPEKVAGTAKLISGIAETALSSVSGMFHLAENTPGLKQVADTINIPFTAAGFASSWATGKAVDWIPDSILSKESKAVIKQPLQDVGSLAGQIVLGGKIMDKLSGEVKKGEVVTPEKTAQLVEEAKAETASHPAMTQTSTSSYEQFQQETAKKTILPEQKIPEGQAINTRAQDLLQASVEKKLIEAVDTGEIPTHARMNMAEQAKGAVDLIETDQQKALDIALGHEAGTNGVLPESVYTALEIKAIKEGDVELMRQLSKSQLPTMAGQALKALDSADPNSPVKIMRDIEKARESALEKKTKKKVSEEKVKVVKEIKEKIPKVGKQTWDDFINELTCNY